MTPPDYSGVWKLLYDWQTIIAGVLAIVAAGIGAAAAYYVGNAQMKAAKQRDRLQARCLSVAIFPELLQLGVLHERATNIIADQFPKAKCEGWATASTVHLILEAQIKIPPLLYRTIDLLYLVEEAGPTLLQLISVTLQYNDMIKTIAQHIQTGAISFDPPVHANDLSGQLCVIGRNISDAERLIRPFHDEATASGNT
ncbi:hypothetical protein [Acidiphilium iwatense]|uniref:Transmembrane protein n=1 Tax=Acidiphilium iwatense TaxID=768198 RepID=A0ABS9E158_9PROT|nr:hypothetical protein [Acidiphilium iwatense]MCF3948743.1 hypothetical protein [Acidiphilium iwatense]